MSVRLSRLPAATVTADDIVIIGQLSTTVTYTATTISAQASDNSLNDSAGQFVAEGFVAGHSIQIAGFTGDTGNNHFTAVILSVTAGKIVLKDEFPLVDDAAGESVTLTRWTTGRDTVANLLALAGSSESGLRGLTFTSDTGSTADSDPGAGRLKWDNATQGSATYLYVDEETADSVNLDTFFASLGSSGFVYLQQSDDATKWQLWKWTGVAVDGTGYWKLPVALQASGGSIADAKTVFCDFAGAGGGGSSSDSFKTIAIGGQSDVVADSSTDTLTLVAGSGVTLTTDAATDTITISASGGSAGRHGIPIAAGAMSPSSTNGCQFLQRTATTAGNPDILSIDFDPTVQEYAEFSIVMPPSWDEGTITFVPYWSHADTTTNFGVVWQLQAVAIGNGDSTDTAFGTAQTSTDTGGTTNCTYIGPESSAITVAGTPGAGEKVCFRLARVVASGSDTMAIDARLEHIMLYITTDASVDP